MANTVIHPMDVAWSSSSPDLVVGLGSAPEEGFPVSNRFTAAPAAVGAVSSFVPAAPLDLGEFDEIRFWVRADRRADGSSVRPFLFEFSYTDAGDLPGEEHRFFVPVNGASRWEQRRIGIESDRRSAVTEFRFRCLTPIASRLDVSSLMAVREEMLLDLERALVDTLGSEIQELSALPLDQPAAAGATEVQVAPVTGFHAGNRVRIDGGTLGTEIHDVIDVVHAPTATTLVFDVGQPLLGDFVPATGRITLLVPAVIENPPATTPLPTPAVVLTHLDLREDLARSPLHTQRDTFRPRGSDLEFSERPAARAFLSDYQIVAIAPERRQQALVQSRVVERLSADRGLLVDGAWWPLRMIDPPELERRRFGTLTGAYVRVGARKEVALRSQQRRLRRVVVEAGRSDAPLERELVELEL